MDGKPPNEPIPAITAGGGHIGEVRTYLAKYSGAEENFGHWAKIRALLNKYGGYNLPELAAKRDISTMAQVRATVAV